MSTKEFFLNSKIVAQGRDAIANFITAYLPSAPQHFPVAAPGQLNSFLAGCEQSAQNWIKYAQGGRFHTDMIFNEAVAASSWATVASEIAVELKWVSRLDYHPEEQEKSSVTPQMRSFARDVNRLLNVMETLAQQLRDSDQGDAENTPADELAFQRRQRLQQALYLCNLGVSVTCPANYIYHHPDAHKWLSLRASVRQRFDQANREAQKADRELARQYRGQTKY
jgi:hypothetical protein